VSGVAICGGTQPLGAWIARRYLAQRLGEVVVVGIEPADQVPVPTGARYVRADLTDRADVRRVLGVARELGLDGLVNLAFHRDPCAGARALNVEATRALLAGCERHPTLRRFVHRSSAEVYAQQLERPHVLREDQPLNLDPRAPRWVRERVEADVTVSARTGLADRLGICVLRCAEILAPGMGSQLHDYLASRVCLRPLGYDPILNVLSVEDASDAFVRSLTRDVEGAVNVPGADTLPLSRLIRAWGRDQLPIPGPLCGPLYTARRWTRGARFDYRANAWRFHFNGVLDGTRAAEALGYVPRHPIHWPNGG
jgi:UDP-glucose 4-epimerase